MGKNRDRLSIVAAILEAANSGASKTRIMFDANLSFSLLEKYLAVSLSSGLVHVEGYKYQLTESGRDFLRQYRQFEERYLRAQQLIETLGFEREQLSKAVNKSHLLELTHGMLAGE
jgi:predicted transcriptional regulator